MPHLPTVFKADPQLMNTTSLRLLKLLQWLIVSPCSLASLQYNFLHDTDTQKQLSEDTIGLYLNTLRQMGCVIERPVKRNQHCYTLLQHPFKPTIDEAELKALAQFKRQAYEQLAPLDVLLLDDALATLLGEEIMQTLFTQSRTLDYRPYCLLIEELKNISGKGYVLLSYQSPRQGFTSFPFYFSHFVYDKGILYAQGQRQDKPGDSRLRVERIISIEPLKITETEVLSAYSGSRNPSLRITNGPNKTQVVCYLSIEGTAMVKHNWSATLALWEHFVAGEVSIKAIAPHWIEWRASVTDTFLLTQQLLQWPGAVHVMSPQEFVTGWNQELQAMGDLYDPPREVGIPFAGFLTIDDPLYVAME